MPMTVSLLLRLPNNPRHWMLGQVDFINWGDSMPGLISLCSVFCSILRAKTRLLSSQGFSGMNPFNQSSWSTKVFSVK